MIFARKAPAQQERTLKVVHWKHFVPDYDKDFDVFAKEFGMPAKGQALLEQTPAG
jgi:hypothetical protein